MELSICGLFINDCLLLLERLATMNMLEVLLDLPLKNTAAIYNYAVPDHLLGQAEYGRRVLVELGSRDAEGFIVSPPRPAEDDSGLKPIIQVLDVAPVFDKNLFELAQWVAHNYICPVSTALRSMIPPVLHRKRGKWVVPLVSRGEMEGFLRESDLLPAAQERVIRVLFKEQAVSLAEALTSMDHDILNLLEDNSCIDITGKYGHVRLNKTTMTYRLSINPDIDIDMASLGKRAPRQAELLRMLMLGEREMIQVDRIFPPSSIKSLMDKGYISAGRKNPISSTSPRTLQVQQKKAVEAISQGIVSARYKEYLLHGVTASGKTEVYLQSIGKCLDCGKSALVLVPEIALTRHLMGQFLSRYPETAVLHSSMRSLERYEAWKRIKNGEARLVLGTRSAIFAPMPNPGLIIIDEEHENTYKQEDNPKYHAAEVARYRARFHQAVVVYGSATPSLDTYYRSRQGEIKLLQLSQRVANQERPAVHVQDMRKEGFSNTVIRGMLADRIQAALNSQSQCILFLNRRGYAPVCICRQCGWVMSCPYCSVSLNYHQDRELNICHYCNHQQKMISACEECGSQYLDWGGYGTQKVEAEISKLFPRARIARLDMDSSRVAGTQEKILQGMKNSDIDILIGTQMVAKGLDFPSVSLVGILNADAMLNLPDYRAGERAFQLMVQAAGRAGRGHMPGEVVIQTYNPDHPVIGWAVADDYQGFYQTEIESRKLLNYPPFTHILRMVLSGKDEKGVEQTIESLRQQIYDLIDAREDDLDILGPAPCPISRLRKRYRQQIIIKCNNMLLLRSIGEKLIYSGIHKDYQISAEINPLTMI